MKEFPLDSLYITGDFCKYIDDYVVYKSYYSSAGTCPIASIATRQRSKSYNYNNINFKQGLNLPKPPPNLIIPLVPKKDRESPKCYTLCTIFSKYIVSLKRKGYCGI